MSARPSPPLALAPITLSIYGALFSPLLHAQEHGAQALPEVVVTAPGYGEDNGFRSESATVGPLGNRSLLDTPHSISVINAEMIENRQARSLHELLKYAPSAQMEARGGADVGRPQTRGMQSSVVANNHLDGMNVVGTTAYPMEQFERVEIISGLTGALYGPASPAGNFHYVTKRPTYDFLNRVTAGYTTRGQGLIHADLGGSLGESKAFGYRLNLLKEKGEGHVRHSDLDRELISVGVDLRFSNNTVLELNASHYEFDKLGFPGSFSYGPTTRLPDAPDPDMVGLGQSFGGMELDTDTASFRLKHRFNENWHMTAGMLQQQADRALFTPSNVFTDNAGAYTTRINASAPRFDVVSYAVNLNGRAWTGNVKHDLVFGINGFDWDIHQSRDIVNHTLGSASIHAPVRYPEVAINKGGPRYHSSSNEQRSLIIGDTMTLDERWSAMAVVSKSWLRTDNFNLSGVKTSEYDDDGYSPTVALTFKPRPGIATYVAYADSLEQGGSAPSTAANGGESLKPHRSEQWEMGVKTRFAGFDASAAIFRIERPFAFTDPADNVYKEQGNQVNKGLELSLSGKIYKGLSVYGGVTFLDPKLKDTGNPLTTDKDVVGVPKVQANLLMEYRLASIPGLTLDANIHHTGKRAADTANSHNAKRYTTLDLGARYVTRVYGKNATFRLVANNVTDEDYWLSIFPGSINGTVGGNSAFLGSPREIRLAASIDF